MKANNILNRILAELSSIREVKFEQMTLENGAVLEAESFEAGESVFIVDGEERVAHRDRSGPATLKNRISFN